ncbi:Cro/CI family transcriptional regulator [Burkholderia arboris]|uniref:Cro/CI family transcriptional regulator n=1 Tax=Burkholderia arboris TaxID=488730 RepID=UPI001CF38A72|nr:Cro/CI family transcriptional regulator [Burkholderia arboris]MCA8492582.1 Cro/CI family transcriptional regulator [Burkholderia arboris]
MEPDKRDPYACQLIDELGGTSAVANLFEIDPGAVSQWRRNGIPKPRMQYLRLARPDVFLKIGEPKGTP